MAKKISVIIPTIHEESVFELLDEIYKLLGSETEIIIVDKSNEAYFERLKKTKAKVIRQRNAGVENAIMMGMREAKGDIIANIDADYTHDPRGLVEGVKIVESGKADLVLGNRMNNVEPGAMSTYVKFGNRVLSWLFSSLYHVKVHDYLTGLFVMNRKAFEEIREMEPYRAGNAWFAVDLAKRGYKISEVDIKYSKRREGESKLTNSKLGYGMTVASHLIRQIRDYSPLLVFGGIGLIFIILGLIIGVEVLIVYINTGLLLGIGRSLIAFMLITVGLLAILSGFIIDLLLELERRITGR